MTSFDPYHLWLGIPPDEQPPNHYRLLGAPLLEANPTVIENSADRQMAHVRTFQTGPHSALSQRLLNEISQARICLLNSKSKAQYDAALRATIPAPGPAARSGTVAHAVPSSSALSDGPDEAFGDYELLECLNQARNGELYKARHRTLGKVVALKILSTEASHAREMAARFLRKIKILANLKHDNLIAAYDGGERDGRLYMAMEYVDGHDLVSHMKAHGLPGIAESLDYVRQAASGLAHAHDHQVFHRNVKPPNLMLDRQGVVKVVGMGLALLGDDADIGEFDQITQAGEQLGSSDFMAPEQTNDSHEIDQRADIYSLGCTLYFLLTGKIPYPGKGAMEKFLAHRSAPIPSIRDRRPDAPEHVDELFKKMVAKQPQDRFQTMHEVLAALSPVSQSRAEAPPQESLDGFLHAVDPGTVRRAATPTAARRAGAGQVAVPIAWIALGAAILVVGLAIAMLSRM